MAGSLFFSLFTCHGEGTHPLEESLGTFFLINTSFRRAETVEVDEVS